MNSKDIQQRYKVRYSHFPVSIFAVTFGVLLFMSWLHFIIIQAFHLFRIEGIWTTIIIITYWMLVSSGFTFFTRWQMRKSYEEPMQEMAKAANAVAKGDFSVYLSPIHTAEKLDYLDIMIMDFNKMVEELGSIETLKTDFFSNVSHEIKTPLAVILNSAQLLQKSELDEKQQDAVGAILLSGKRLSALITNILKLNKLEKQNIQPVMEEYDLCSQLCACALQFESLWEEKQLEFEADIEDRVNIEADVSLLELVWTNLLSNAIKFTEPGGQIILKQIAAENEIIVTIKDNGCGMSRETVSHIFDKFYQGDTSHSTEGNGLGLALSFRIIQMLDGEITVESEIGKGSLFTIRLPIKQIVK